LIPRTLAAILHNKILLSPHEKTFQKNVWSIPSGECSRSHMKNKGSDDSIEKPSDLYFQWMFKAFLHMAKSNIYPDIYSLERKKAYPCLHFKEINVLILL